MNSRRFARSIPCRSLLLAILFLLMTVTTITASSFPDTEGHWAESQIQTWSEYGVVVGDDRGFRPNDAVTRAEFAVILDNIMNYIEVGSNPFTDLHLEQWYYEPMLALHTAGVLNGEDGQAQPRRNITRQEAAVLIAGVMKIESGADRVSFADDDEIAAWALDDVRALAARGIISGMPDETFRPHDPLTRAQAVTILDQAIAQLVAEAGEFSQDVSGNVVVNVEDVELRDMEIDGDLYIAQGVGEGDVSLDNVRITGSVYVFGGGENSILFNNVQVGGALVVNKYNGQVRILATGNTSVSVTVLDSGAMLVTKDLEGGGFETVEISADVLAGQSIVLDGNFKQVVNQSETARITANGTIGELVAEVDTNIEGDVTVEQVTSEGTKASVNDQPVASDDTGRSGTVPGRGSSGGGGSGGRSDVSVTGVSIDQGSLHLVVGETVQLTASVEPSNATDKNVNWSVVDDHTDVITVSEDGLVEAVGPGSAHIRVTTVDGSFTDEIEVIVTRPAFGFGLTAFTVDAADPESVVDVGVLANSGKVDPSEVVASVFQTASYEAMVVGNEQLEEAGAEGEAWLQLVVHVQDESGQPIADPSGISVTVTSATYSNVHDFGAGLAGSPGSFILVMDAGQPESIQSLQIALEHDDYERTTLDLTYIPYGTPYIVGIENISGETTIGSVLSAGEVIYAGDPVDPEVNYQWLRAHEADGHYTIIEGASESTYVVTAEDGGQYIRVRVEADQDQAGGYALSPAFGPVKEPVDPEDVYATLEALFLAENSNRDNIVSDLNLVTELDEYPDVSISWTSSDVSVISTDGIVNRDAENDVLVELTVTLDGAASGSKTYELIVRAEGTDQVELEDFIDPYFSDNYPQAYIQDETIWVRFKLDEPAEVFMVVNAINGYWDASVKAVLEGRAGGDTEVIDVDKWPYFHVEDAEQVYDFDTGVTLRDGITRIEFVIVDKSNNYTSEEVTSIVFDQEIVDALDTEPPYTLENYLNKDADAIYVYFDEWLDLSYSPDPGEFELNYGVVEDVELDNYDLYSLPASYVKLAVSGISEEQRSDLMLTYNGDSLRDPSDAGNKVQFFTKEVFDMDMDESITHAVIGSQRQNMAIEIEPGWSFHDNEEWNFDNTLFTVSVNEETFTPRINRMSWSTYYFSYFLTFDSPLPDGAISLELDTSNIVGWAKDPYPATISPTHVEEIGAPGIPVAQYNSAYGELMLSFADGWIFDYARFAGGFVIEVDGTEYALRGGIASRYNDNQLKIALYDEYTEHIRQAVESGGTVTIRYEKVAGDDPGQLTDYAGSLLPDFDPVPVTVE